MAVLTRNRFSFEFPILTINLSEAEHKHDTKLIIVGYRSIIDYLYNVKL